MKTYFADTSFFAALVNPDDVAHQKAASLSCATDLRLVTTDYVIVELGSYLCGVENRQLFGKLVQTLRSGRNVKIVPASRELLNHGLALFDKRPDKDWSVVDCISFIVMERLGLSQSLTTDSHFSQAGFEALLKI